MKDTYDEDELRGYAEAGLSIAEIAEELGVSYNAARMALKSRNISYSYAWQQSIRQRAENMPLREAVDFLLECLESGFDALSHSEHEVDNLGIHLPPCERRILIALFEAEGRVLSRGQLLSAAHFGRDKDYPLEKTVDVWISRLRKKISGLPLKIRSRWGQGYFLEREASS